MVYYALISGPADEHKAPITITAFNIAAIINFQPNTWMTKRRAAWNLGCAVARNAARFHANCFWSFAHGAPVITAKDSAQLLIDERD
jgi:hypothetical protein